MSIKKLYLDNRSFLRVLALYGLIGGLAAIADFSLFYILNTPLGLNKFAANIISMHAGMIISFSLNAKLNFKKTDKLIYRFLFYYLIVLFGMGLSSLILFAGSFAVKSDTALKAFSVVFVAGVQFILNKLITFKF